MSKHTNTVTSICTVTAVVANIFQNAERYEWAVGHGRERKANWGMIGALLRHINHRGRFRFELSEPSMMYERTVKITQRGADHEIDVALKDLLGTIRDHITNLSIGSNVDLDPGEDTRMFIVGFRARNSSATARPAMVGDFAIRGSLSRGF